MVINGPATAAERDGSGGRRLDTDPSSPSFDADVVTLEDVYGPSIDTTQREARPTDVGAGRSAGKRRPTYAAIHLDAIRGLAAFAVVIYHIRYNFFFDYSQVGQSDVFTKLFYTATSFGHDAVVVFFVLSGYLISGSILKDLRAGAWSPSHYLLNRLTRLYVVLIPGLLLTVFWDQLGMHLFPGHPVYTGAPQTWIHDFSRVADHSSVSTFFANLAFLHAMNGVPPYGTAGPLWSLTYEFAYYLIFPAALLIVWRSSRWPVRIGGAIATALLVRHFSAAILLMFPIWLLGFVLQLLPLNRRIQHGDPRLRSVGIAIAIVCGIAMTHASLLDGLRHGVNGSQLYADYITGLVFSAGLYILLHDLRSASETLYVRGARMLSQMSYSMYVVHMSFLLFLRAVIVKGQPWHVEWRTVLFTTLLAAATVAYAGLVWFVAESRTDQVRRFFSKRLFHSRQAEQRPFSPAHA